MRAIVTGGAGFIGSHAVDALVSGGGTAVYDATETGIEAIAGLHDTSRINAVVVLTDGDDNGSRLSSGRLVRLLRGRAAQYGPEPRRHEPCDRDADGGERLRCDAGAAGRG